MMCKSGMGFADTYKQKLKKEGICMKGGVYRTKGRGAPFAVKFGKIYRRFWDEEEANRFLQGLRWEVDRGSFDERDHAVDQPLGLANLVDEYLEIRRPELKSWRVIRIRLEKASRHFGNTSIKEIGYQQLRKFFQKQDVSLATKDAVKRALRAFWSWVQDEHDIPMPKFPSFKYEYKRKRTVGKYDQQRIVAKVEENEPPRVGLAVRFLSTYISIRPGELVTVKEGDFDFDQNLLWIDGKTGQKEIPMLEEDLDIVKTMLSGNPEAPFFRHDEGRFAGRALREAGLLRAWYRACAELDIKGVDLYRGTRHSSARALVGQYGLEEIRKGTLHATSKCFDRYVHFGGDDLREIYRAAREPG